MNKKQKVKFFTFTERGIHLGLKRKKSLLCSTSLCESAVRTYVRRHDNLNFIVQVNIKGLEFESPGQFGGVKQFLLSILNANRHWFEESKFCICPLPVWQGCSRYQQVPSFSFNLFPLISTGLSNCSWIIHFPQSCPHNLIQYHFIKDFGFMPFYFCF